MNLFNSLHTGTKFKAVRNNIKEAIHYDIEFCKYEEDL